MKSYSLVKIQKKNCRYEHYKKTGKKLIMKCAIFYILHNFSRKTLYKWKKPALGNFVNNSIGNIKNLDLFRSVANITLSQFRFIFPKVDKSTNSKNHLLFDLDKLIDQVLLKF
jgi:hypothetical protein